MPSTSTSSPVATAAISAPIGCGLTPRRVPNMLTVSRLLLAVAFFVVLSPWQYEKSPAPRGHGVDWWLFASAILFIVAAITDALDGLLARRWGVVSIFGRVMDPFADKL